MLIDFFAELQEADSDDNSRITGSIFGGSSAGRSSIRSKLSHVSAKMHRRGSHQSDSGVSTAQIPPPQTMAEQVAKTSKADWPELQCGLMFDELTKRLSIRILRANRLKAPEATIGSPSMLVLQIIEFNPCTCILVLFIF